MQMFHVVSVIQLSKHIYYILRELNTAQNVLWARTSVCLSVCPWPYAHTTAWTRM